MTQILTGTVVSAKVPQTLTIEISTKLRHARYKKVISRTKKLKVHTDGSVKAKEGDVIEVRACRPISKTKHHVISKIV